MRTFEYTIGTWNVKTSLEDADDSKRLAIISARANGVASAAASRHTVIFEHDPQCDEIEEAKIYAERVLNAWH